MSEAPADAILSESELIFPWWRNEISISSGFPWLVQKGQVPFGCLKMLCTPKPNGFADHYPYEMAIAAISLGI